MTSLRSPRPGLAVLHMASQTLQVAPSTRFIAHRITILRRWHPCQLAERRDGLPALASCQQGGLSCRRCCTSTQLSSLATAEWLLLCRMDCLHRRWLPLQARPVSTVISTKDCRCMRMICMHGGGIRADLTGHPRASGSPACPNQLPHLQGPFYCSSVPNTAPQLACR